MSETLSTTTITQRFAAIRQQTEKLCAPLRTEDYIPQPMVDVSPPKWHLGHTTWFFETFLLKAFLPHYKEFDEDFGFIFNSYYETIGKRVVRADRGNLTRPSVKEVYAYRAYVNEHMELLLSKHISEEVEPILEIGLQHEQQHQELLLTDLKYILGTNPLLPPYRTDLKKTVEEPNTKVNWLEMDEGIYTIGHVGEGFCFDNELGLHQVYLQPYRMQDRLVTNGEYLEFIKAGGYQQFQHWLAEGWDFVQQNELKAPEYWHQIDGEWYYYSLSGLQPIELDTPVTHISFYEADAYASWRGLRLPTEFEWEALARTHCSLEQEDIGNFVDADHLHPTARTDNENQLFGNCWEWTGSAYLAYPNFKKPDGALGEYNGKFMINQMVLKGGSVATPSSHIRSSYRNFFHADKRWQFTGIRLAESI